VLFDSDFNVTKTNALVECCDDSCKELYHQLCHEPNIRPDEHGPSILWFCHNCSYSGAGKKPAKVSRSSSCTSAAPTASNGISKRRETALERDKLQTWKDGSNGNSLESERFQRTCTSSTLNLKKSRRNLTLADEDWLHAQDDTHSKGMKKTTVTKFPSAKDLRNKPIIERKKGKLKLI